MNKNSKFAFINKAEVQKIITIFQNEGAEIRFVGGCVRNIILQKEVKDIGEYYTTWNGEDSYGNLMPSGIYFVKMNYDNNQLINKVTLLK